MFLASNSLHDLEDKKWICPCYNSLNFKQIRCNTFFCRMYGLAVMLSVTISTTSKNIFIVSNIQVRLNNSLWILQSSAMSLIFGQRVKISWPIVKKCSFSQSLQSTFAYSFGHKILFTNIIGIPCSVQLNLTAITPLYATCKPTLKARTLGI